MIFFLYLKSNYHQLWFAEKAKRNHILSVEKAKRNQFLFVEKLKEMWEKREKEHVFFVFLPGNLKIF